MCENVSSCAAVMLQQLAMIYMFAAELSMWVDDMGYQCVDS
jgi:hypothetical protein